MFRWLLEGVAINAEDVETDDKSLLQLALHSEHSQSFFETLLTMAHEQHARNGENPNIPGLVIRKDRGRQLYEASYAAMRDTDSSDDEDAQESDDELHDTDFDSLLGARDSAGQSLLHHLSITANADVLLIVLFDVFITYIARINSYDKRNREKRGDIRNTMFEWKDNRGRTAMDVAAAQINEVPKSTPSAEILMVAKCLDACATRYGL